MADFRRCITAGRLPALLKTFFPWPFIAEDTKAVSVAMAGFDS